MNKKQIDELKERVEEKEEEIKNLKSQLNSIKRSITWKTLQKWDSFINRIFPENHPIKNHYYSWLSRRRGEKSPNKDTSKKEITKKARTILMKIAELKITKYSKVHIITRNQKKPLYHLYLENQIKNKEER